MFLIDLPKSDKAERTTRDNMPFFGKELVHFLEAMGLQQEIVDSVYKFDFSETKSLAFVHSMSVLSFLSSSSERSCDPTADAQTSGGPHIGEEWRRTGYCGLGKAVRMLGLQHEGPVQVDFVVSVSVTCAVVT